MYVYVCVAFWPSGGALVGLGDEQHRSGTRDVPMCLCTVSVSVSVSCELSDFDLVHLHLGLGTWHLACACGKTLRGFLMWRVPTDGWHRSPTHGRLLWRLDARPCRAPISQASNDIQVRPTPAAQRAP
eukprot:scaffold12862_cov116-Isochrysis_galbana.AAC.1